MDAKKIGIYRKFEVRRVDGRSAEGEKHHGCFCFVLDVDHDPFSIAALKAYAEACKKDYPALAEDIGYDWEEEAHMLDAQAEVDHDQKTKSRRFQVVGIWKERGHIDEDWNHAGVWKDLKRIVLCVKASICILLGIIEPEGVKYPVEALHLFTLDGGETGGSWNDPPDYWAIDLCVPLKGWFVFTESI
ncbi:hypothetical protein LCGC14_1844760 [marine sediment metagenome]|uniref:Uncharacterized protein n=1 Tax=marine sediment metagenome TaxID=412755 RepID=A0A0F9GC23_9ZZZZ